MYVKALNHFLGQYEVYVRVHFDILFWCQSWIERNYCIQQVEAIQYINMLQNS